MKSCMTVMFLLVAALVSTASAIGPAHASTARATAQIALSPDAGPVGTIFELTGSGFEPFATGNVTFDGIDLGMLSSDEFGNVRGFFMVPDVRVGPAHVRVIFGKTRARATFEVLPAD